MPKICRGRCMLGNIDQCKLCSKHTNPEHRQLLIKEALLISDAWESKTDITNLKPTSEKIQVNKIIVETLKPIIKGNESHANMLTLDGANLYTSTRWIRGLKIPAKNIIVPAPFNSSHGIIQHKESNDDLLDLNIRKEFVFDTLSTTETSFVGVFLDYCSTLEGNKWCRPRLDIDVLFRRRLLCSEMFPTSILFVTFSARNPIVKAAKIVKSKIKGRTFSQIQEVVQLLALKYGYNAIPCSTMSYSQSMFVCGFKVTRATNYNIGSTSDVKYKQKRRRQNEEDEKSKCKKSRVIENILTVGVIERTSNAPSINSDGCYDYNKVKNSDVNNFDYTGSAKDIWCF